MPTGQNYATNVPQTQLTSSINATATSMSVVSATGWPSPPFSAVIDLGTSSQEPVDVTAVVGTSFTITRSIDGTSAFAHTNGATVTHADIGRDFREPRAHIDASTSPDSTGHDIHGIGGGAAVVGTTTSQTLSNKTISAGNYTGGQAMGSGAWTGTGSLQEASLGFTGITGANSQNTRLAGSKGTGPPISGTFLTGDITVDSQLPVTWYCTAGGTPGAWVPLSGRTLLASQVLGASTNTITFSNFPTLFHSLEIVVSAKSDGATAAGYDAMMMTFNNITTANYNWNSFFLTQGSAAMGTAGANAQTSVQCGEIWNAHFGTNGRGIANIQIPNYADTNNAKVFTANASATAGGANGIMQTFTGALDPATSTAAISTIKLIMGTGNFVADSTFYLYGIW